MNKKKYIITIVAVVIIKAFFVSWYWHSFTQFGCSETKPYDFNQKVETKDEAIKLFKHFFSEENGYPPFDESKVYEFKDSKERYNYYGKFVLHEKGKLVEKGYCK